MKKLILVIALVSFWPILNVHAVPILITNPNQFSGNETLLTFAGLSLNQDVTNLGGVTFSSAETNGSYSGLRVGQDAGFRQFPVPGDIKALYNWNSNQGQLSYPDFYIQFDSNINRFAFEIRGHASYDLDFTLTALLGGQTIDTISLSVDNPTSDQWQFLGFETAVLFDTVFVDIADNYPTTAPIDSMRFESTIASGPIPEPAPVPEPTTMLLLGIGLVGLVSAAVRRRFKKAKE